jgi:hypothetical protein
LLEVAMELPYGHQFDADRAGGEFSQAVAVGGDPAIRRSGDPAIRRPGV